MVLRREAVQARLLRLEEVTSRLLELAGPSDATSPSFRDDWAVERGLQLGAEIVLDIGNHILAAHFGASAADYEDIIRKLGEHAVIGPPVQDRLTGLGGFRNILVHGYLEIDPDRLRQAASRAPADFSAFAGAIREWLERL